MIVLGIDTTSPYCAVALVKDGVQLAGGVLEGGYTHSETLLPLIASCFEKASIKVSDVDLFALSSCPGSFTGVRIGASTVKGLAFASSIPCVGVSTLEALAYNLKDREGYVVPVMDARRNQFYNAVFYASRGEIKRITEDRLISAEELSKELDIYQGDIYFVGDGYSLANSKIKKESIKQTPAEAIPQNGYSVAMLGEKVYNEAEDKSVFTDLALKPGYLRASQAEREKNEKTKL